MKALLHELIDWLEECHSRRSPCGLPFEAQMEPALVAKAQLALSWALDSRKPVELFTTTIDPKPLLAAVILERTRVDLASFYRREVDHSAFPRLTGCLARIARSQFRLVPGHPPADFAPSAFFGGPLYAVLHV